MKKIALFLASGAALAAVPAFAQEANSTFTGPRVEGDRRL